MPASIEAPIVRSLSAELPGNQSAVYGSRIWIRLTVTALFWPGDVLRAVEAISRLVDNGVQHGMPADVPMHKRRLSLCAAISEARELVIDVSDLNPSFPDFEAAVRGEKGRGLWQVAHLGARVVRFLPHEGVGKTVRAVLPPGPVDL
ncbi:ATP-binding protein [Streptomyces ossamyceticus]|uniref:ATP-binding protein n=1 Tax=Streptomyces ossamyceticus TaxID=249581 RepID=UPI0036EE440B